MIDEITFLTTIACIMAIPVAMAVVATVAMVRARNRMRARVLRLNRETGEFE